MSKFGGVAVTPAQGGSRFGGVTVNVPRAPVGNAEPGLDMADIQRQLDAQESDPNMLTGIGGSFLNGGLMGFGDEAVGVAGGLTGAAGNAAQWIASPVLGAPDRNPAEAFGQDYTALQGYTDRQNDRFREDHPLIAAGAELAGGMGSGFGLAGRGVTTLGRFGTGGNAVSTALGRVGEGVVEGLGYGAVSGFGNADGNPLERMDDTLWGAGVGGIFGGAMPVVARAAAPIITPIKNAWESATDPVKRGLDLVATAARRDNLDLDAVELEMAAAHAQGKPFTYTDAAGTNTQGRLNAAARSPGDTQNDVANFMADRKANAAGRVNDDIGGAVGRGQNSFADEQAIIQQMKADATTNYNTAYATPTPQSPALDRLRRLESVRGVTANLPAIAREAQLPVSNVLERVQVPHPRAGQLRPDGTSRYPAKHSIEVPTVRGWDLIKRDLDAQITALQKNGGGPQMDALIMTRNQLREELANKVPGYRQALSKWSSDQESLEAVDLGRRLITAPNGDEAMAAFNALPDPQKELARVAAARELMGQSTRAGERGANPAAAIYGSARPGSTVGGTGGRREKLRALFPDQKSYDEFASRMDRENVMNETNRLTQSGSRTANNNADMADAGFGAGGQAVGVVQNILQGRLGAASGQAMGLVANMFNGVNEQTAKEMVRMLLSQDPADIAVLRSFMSDQQRAQAAQALFQSGATAAAPAVATPYTSR